MTGNLETRNNFSSLVHNGWFRLIIIVALIPVLEILFFLLAGTLINLIATYPHP